MGNVNDILLETVGQFAKMGWGGDVSRIEYVVGVDEGGRHVSLDHTAQLVDGATVDDALGTHIWDWVDSHSQRERFRKDFQDSVESGSPRHLECTVEGVLYATRINPTKSSAVAVITSHRKLESPLSDREHRLLLLLADGWTVKQAAAQLGVCHSTCRTMLVAARERVGAATNEHMIAMGFRNGWL